MIRSALREVGNPSRNQKTISVGREKILKLFMHTLFEVYFYMIDIATCSKKNPRLRIETGDMG